MHLEKQIHMRCPFNYSRPCRRPPRRTACNDQWIFTYSWCKSTYIVAAKLLLLVELRIELVDTRPVIGWITAESNIKVLQEFVAASEQRLRCIGSSVNSRLAIEDDDSVRKICCHDKIVLDNEGSLLRVHDETLDDAGSYDTLLGIEVCRRFIDEVNICW